MTPRLRPAVLVLASTASAVLLAGCGSSASVVGPSVSPALPSGLGPAAAGAVLASPPATPPAVTLRHGVCFRAEPGAVTADAAPSTSKGQLVVVDRNPTGVIASWRPGLNARTCHASMSHLGAKVAGRLARDIDAAPASPAGPRNCPSDDASGVTLYFTYSGHGDEVANVALTGCGSVGAPGRTDRDSTQALGTALRRAARTIPLAGR